MFCRRIHLKPFLRLEYVILRDDTVHKSAQAHAYTGGGQQDAGQRRLVGQGHMDVIRRPSRLTQRDHVRRDAVRRVVPNRRSILDSFSGASACYELLEGVESRHVVCNQQPR